MGRVWDSAQALIQNIQAAKATAPDLTVVATNGCFDLMHVGHLRYLKAAKALGDRLIVAINTDRSVQALKGPKRPIVPEDERAELLAHLDFIDDVILFSDESPLELLLALKPDIYAKGAQYTVETLPEAKPLMAIGTQIKLLPMVAGRSTSQLIQRILEAEAADRASV